MKPTMGNSKRYILFSLPFKSGIKNAPMINIAAGGTGLIIVILPPLYKRPQDVLRYKNQDDKSYKSIYCIELGPLLPWEIRMLMYEELNENNDYERGIEYP
jgi:hypothetical protein